MADDASVALRVVAPAPSDVSEGRCRLDRETMVELGLDPGDVVEVSHDLGTVGARVSPADDDWKPSRDVARESVGIRLGTRLPGPSSDFSGERVTVRKVPPAAAERVVYEGLPEWTSPEARAVVSDENLLGVLAVAGTRMAVYERSGSTTRGHLLRVLETDPSGVVVVTDETRLVERPFGAT